MRKIIRSFGHAFRGVAAAYRADESFRLEVWLGLPVFIIIAAVLWPLSGLEAIILVLCYGLILAMEFLNTSIETLLDRLHPEQHPEIGASKDMASAAMLVVFIVVLIVVLILLSAEF